MIDTQLNILNINNNCVITLLVIIIGIYNQSFNMHACTCMGI